MLYKWCPLILGVLAVAQSMSAATISDKELLDALLKLINEKNQELNEESNITINSSDPLTTTHISTTKICALCTCAYDRQVLDCSQRYMERIFKEVDLKNLPVNFNVTLANFSYNNIEDLFPFPALQLKTLDLSHNWIGKLSFSTFRYLKQLETLDLGYNKLEAASLIPDVFERENGSSSDSYQALSSMKTLILTGNYFKTLHPDAFQHLGSLKELQIGNNPFQEIDWDMEVALNSLVNLEYLDLSYTQIKDLPGLMLASCKKLKSLNLKGNFFKEIPGELKFIKSLEILIMDENPLEEFLQDKQGIPEMVSLKELHLSNIRSLQYLDASQFSSLRNLQKLYITNNSRLGDIYHSLGRSGNLKEIYLNNNGLRILDEQFLRSLENVTIIDIRNNSWFCSWNNDSWLTDPVITTIFFDNPTMAKEFVCDSPPMFKGTTMRDILINRYQLRYSEDNYPHIIQTTYRYRDDEEAIKFIVLPVAVGVIVLLLVYIMCMRGWCRCCCKKKYETLDETT